MKPQSIRVAGLAAALFFFTGTLYAQPNLLINGDFENLDGWEPAGGPHTTAPLGWRDDPTRNNAAEPQSGVNAIGGSGTSAYMMRNAFAGVEGSTSGGIRQTLATQSGPVYEWAFDFATEDPGKGAQRSLSLAFRHGTEKATTAIMRIVDQFDAGIGDFQVFTGGAWQTILPFSIVFDNDVTVDPLVHNFSMTIDSTATPPSYDLRITDSNGGIHEVLGSTWFQGDGPGPVNQGGIEVEFVNQLSTINRGWLIDNISLRSLADFPSLPGDFDGDGKVDGHDFLAWQRGESPNPFGSDDLQDWEAAFGSMPELTASTAVVPEPGSMMILLGCGVLGAALARFRRD